MGNEERGVSYRDAGVDVDLGDTASEILYNAARRTWENRRGRLGEIVQPQEDFSGIRYVRVGDLEGDAVMGVNTDGVGTKVEIAERFSLHSTIAHDLLAMVCDDAVRDGAEPVLVGNILDVNTLGGNIEIVRELAAGLVDAAGKAYVAVLNGELAELGGRIGGYGAFNYNWGAFAVWVREKKRLITGLDVKPGDSIVALRERGFRSNGLSLVRKILEKRFGEDWHEVIEKRFAEQLLLPSEIYSGTVMKMIGAYGEEGRCEIKGMAHVTGGGIPGKLGRLLKRTGYGAELDDLFEPPEAMRQVQEWGNVTDREAYRTWNMGQGMLVVTGEAEAVIGIAGEDGMEAKVAGMVNDGGEIVVESKGVEARRTLLRYRTE